MSNKISAQGPSLPSANYEQFLRSDGVRKGASPEAVLEITQSHGRAMQSLELFAGTAVQDAERLARTIGSQSRSHHHGGSGLWKPEARPAHRSAHQQTRRESPLTQADLDSLATPIDLNRLPD